MKFTITQLRVKERIDFILFYLKLANMALMMTADIVDSQQPEILALAKNIMQTQTA
jgi:uncharacterized protein (DUF305 family)